MAAAAMILSARQLCKKHTWNKEVEQFTGYSESDLKTAISEVKQFAVEINPKFIQILKYKFSKNEYLNVSKHQFKFWISQLLIMFISKIKNTNWAK